MNIRETSESKPTKKKHKKIKYILLFLKLLQPSWMGQLLAQITSVLKFNRISLAQKTQIIFLIFYIYQIRCITFNEYQNIRKQSIGQNIWFIRSACEIWNRLCWIGLKIKVTNPIIYLKFIWLWSCREWWRNFTVVLVCIKYNVHSHQLHSNNMNLQWAHYSDALHCLFLFFLH